MDGGKSAILRKKNITILLILYFNIYQLEKSSKKVDRMRNGYIIDMLTSVDSCEIVKIGGKLIEIYEGVIYRENFKISPFRKVIEKLFALGQNIKTKKNDLMQGLVIFVMKSLYGVEIRRDINES